MHTQAYSLRSGLRMSSLKLWDPKSGKQAISVSKIYVGEFSQSLYPYDLSCCL